MTTETTTKILPDTLSLLSDSAWDIAHNQLWGKQNFTQEEVKRIKEKITSWFSKKAASNNERPLSELFSEFCQRICIVEKYIKRKSGRYVSHPLKWFSLDNANGFVRSRKWYRENKEKREFLRDFERIDFASKEERSLFLLTQLIKTC